MAMLIYPDMPGMRATATTLSIDYNITGALVSGNTAGPPLDYNAVRAALLAFVPASNAPPGATYAWPRRGLDLKEIGWGVWKATVQWASLTYQYALKIGGSQQQVRCDKFLRQLYADGGQPDPDLGWRANDQGRPIGFDGRTVHGCSIYVPTRNWTETVEIPIAQYTFDYEDAVEAVQLSPVNLYPFRGYAPCEVRFAGMQAQLSSQNPDYVSASFEFERSPNYDLNDDNPQGTLPTITIDNITNITKFGWDYLDVRYQTVATNSTTIPKAWYVATHAVYNTSNFAALNIGTTEALPQWGGLAIIGG